MYTGGGECVLVKWTLANTRQKSFLPRLPAPIKHLTIASDNLYVAVSTLDNGIKLCRFFYKSSNLVIIHMYNE
jgi:NET1-associated nuclear protein 1 (U3 small nucleolar RNA-associated protein 17)